MCTKEIQKLNNFSFLKRNFEETKNQLVSTRSALHDVTNKIKVVKQIKKKIAEQKNICSKSCSDYSWWMKLKN